MLPQDLRHNSLPGAVTLSMPVLPQEYASPGLSLQQLLAIARAYWKQSIAIALLVFLVIALVVVLRPRTYAATATLLVSYDINDPLGGKEFPLALLGSYMSTQMELLSSPVVLMPVVDKLQLTEDADLTQGVRGDLNALRIGAERALEKNLVIEQGRYGSQLIYITYTASSPLRAAEVANTIAEIYTTRAYREDRAPDAERYAAQLEELKNKVATAQDQLSEFSRQSGLIGGEGQEDIEMQGLVSLEQRLLEARNDRRKAEVLASARSTDGSDVLGSSVVQTLKAQLATQQAHMAELRTTDGPRNPRVIELQMQIDSTRKALAEERHAYTGNASSELSNARELEGKLDRAAREQREKVVAERELKAQREKYEVELASAQAAYKRALDGFEQVSRQASSSYNNVSLVSRAMPPTQASGKRTRVRLLFAVMAGLFIGFVGPLLYGLMNRRVRCRDDLERDYGIPVIVEFGPMPT